LRVGPRIRSDRRKRARRNRRKTVIERDEKDVMTARGPNADPQSEATEIAARRRAMALVARARRAELAAIAERWPDHGARDLKPVESGLVMLRGRIGGDGAPFNLGEATVTRAVIELPTGERGFAHILGRDAEKARLAAIADALWQRQPARAEIEATILAPIEARLAAEAAKTRAETAATRVDFFTLVRGEDAA
jgi:alpha-D-ribose 1-methylphosphonate 5-triphosphate synthase subunit PhnG